MAEHRPFYRAFSDLPTHTVHDGPVSVTSSLQKHSTDGSSSKDIILLLPILHSPHSEYPPKVCFHVVHLPDGNVSLFCNGKAEQRCPCCGFSMCDKHASKRSISLPDETGIWPEEEHTLCETCAHLPKQAMYALHAFRYDWISLFRVIDGSNKEL